ncbi:MAG: hypothetical protein ABEL51_12165, partial [Salinibacter sp.]
FEAAWNGFLRLYNLLQFLPHTYPVSSDAGAFWGYEDLIGERSAGEENGAVSGADRFDEEAWETVFEYALDDVRDLLGPLHEARVPAPDVPFGLQRDGQIVAEAELGWPDEKVAVLLRTQTKHKGTFQEQGWTVYEVTEVEDNPQVLLDEIN